MKLNQKGITGAVVIVAVVVILVGAFVVVRLTSSSDDDLSPTEAVQGYVALAAAGECDEAYDKYLDPSFDGKEDHAVDCASPEVAELLNELDDLQPTESDDTVTYQAAAAEVSFTVNDATKITFVSTNFGSN